MASTRSSQAKRKTPNRFQSSISAFNKQGKQPPTTRTKKAAAKSTLSKKKSSKSKKQQTSNSSSQGHRSPSPTQTQGAQNNPDPESSDSTSNSSSSSDSDSGSPLIGFTLDNFQTKLSSWSANQLRKTLQQKKNLSNRIPVDVQEALQLLQQNYLKSKLMLALIGNIGEKTVNKYLGENKPPRKKCGWNRYVAFSLESLKHPVPPKGTSEGWDERNIQMGKAWDLLTDDEKEVFGSRVFQHFSKIPCGYDDEEDDDDTSGQLTPEEIGLYEPLYQSLVNHEKVKAFTANRPESEGQNTGEVYKKALKNVLKLNSELYTTSNMYNTTYYLLSATRAPGINSFCKEYSNDPAWLALAEKRWNSKETFEAYSHGRQIQASLEDIEGGPASSKPLREGDTLKKKLRAALNRLLGELFLCNLHGGNRN
ncbi:hypothetical protein PGT21_031265 [Puccinia graminis f. sp. tritici]|uniref:Uncharacterized protein n=1 Tax=Puccinia graminis f. sp. tritici TaxID=56615 RepID=A0A5B0NF64_PUCGR|nr:hypothetical protein PGT21_031265 [Puccinia graminis f. sp. tritici]